MLDFSLCVSHHYLFSSFKILRNLSALVSALGCFSFSFAASSAFSLRVFFKAVSWHSGNINPHTSNKLSMQGHAVMFFVWLVVCFLSKIARNNHSSRSSTFQTPGHDRTSKMCESIAQCKNNIRQTKISYQPAQASEYKPVLFQSKQGFPQISFVPNRCD